MSVEPADLDATGQAALVVAGEVSPTELVDASIDRIERLNGELNAVIHPRFERARSEAADVASLPQGPFRGVPMVIKDLDGYLVDEPYHAGNAALKQRGFTGPHDSELFRRFKQAGFVVVAKTNTPELGLMPTTEPVAYGPTRNPYDTTRSTGGSSGGSAAAVASGMVPVGHAGDGGGSIRIPASECGLVGLLPSRGRITVGPEVGESWGGLVRRLVVSRSVRDTAGVLDAVWGPMPGDPYTAPPPQGRYVDVLEREPAPMRVGFTTTASDPNVSTEPQVASAVEAAVVLLESLGHQVSESAPACWSDARVAAEFTGAFMKAFTTWTAAELDHLGELSGSPLPEDQVEPGTWATATMGRGVTALEYHGAIGEMHSYTRQLAAWWDGGFDVLVTPTIPGLPPELGQFSGTPDNPLMGLMRAAGLVAFTTPFNVSGQPAISLPLGWSDEGLPIGVQFVGGFGREDLLLGLAAQLERAVRWGEHSPPAVHA